MSKQQAQAGSEMITLKPSEVTVAMDAAHRAGESMMLWGPAGIGKSQISLQYAKKTFPLRSENQHVIEQMRVELENPEIDTVKQEDIDAFEAKLLDQETNFVDVRLSQVEPSDLRGIPVPFSFYVDANGEQVSKEQFGQPGVRETKSVVWASPKMLDLPANWKGVLMFDEVNSAMPIVQAAAYQLFLDRCIGELKLPDGAFIMAAGNREGDGGVTFSLATPLKDRMMHIEMKENVDDWFQWALDNRVHPDVIAFVKTTPKNFNTLSPSDPSPVGGSSPRSWVSVSHLLKKNPHLDTSKEHRKILKAMIAGRVSLGVAGEFMTFREMTMKLPAPDDVLSGKVTAPSGKLDMSQAYALCMNLVFRTLDHYEDRKKGNLETAEWGKLSSNFLKFIDENFGKENPELVILSVKQCMSAKCLFKPKETRYYSTFAANHKSLILSARDL